MLQLLLRAVQMLAPRCNALCEKSDSGFKMLQKIIRVAVSSSVIKDSASAGFQLNNAVINTLQHLATDGNERLKVQMLQIPSSLHAVR